MIWLYTFMTLCSGLLAWHNMCHDDMLTTAVMSGVGLMFSLKVAFELDKEE